MRVPILLYHWFDDGSGVPTASPEFGIAPADFRRQMEWLVESGLRVVPLADIVQALHGGRDLPRHAVAITFDDAYDDFREHALGVLVDLGLPATMFAVSGSIGQTNAWDAVRGEPARPLLDWAGLRELADAGIEIGSHSVTHPDLRTLPNDALAVELTASRELLEDGLGRPVPHFAYPHGLHDDRVKAATRAAGYEAAFAVLLAPWDMLRSDGYALMRAIVHADKSFTNFRLRVRLASPSHRAS